MTKNKSELILNPEYYSADSYVEEIDEDISIKTIMKLLKIITIVSVLILGYTYFIKNNLITISAWFSEVKQIVLFENKKIQPLIIREEPSISKVEVKVKTQKVLLVSSIPKVKPQIIKPKAVQPKELTDEYLRLVQKSLVNY
jgi:hypothetical protein